MGGCAPLSVASGTLEPHHGRWGRARPGTSLAARLGGSALGPSLVEEARLHGRFGPEPLPGDAGAARRGARGADGGAPRLGAAVEAAPGELRPPVVRPVALRLDPAIAAEEEPLADAAGAADKAGPL